VTGGFSRRTHLHRVISFSYMRVAGRNENSSNPLNMSVNCCSHIFVNLEEVLLNGDFFWKVFCEHYAFRILACSLRCRTWQLWLSCVCCIKWVDVNGIGWSQLTGKGEYFKERRVMLWRTEMDKIIGNYHKWPYCIIVFMVLAFEWHCYETLELWLTLYVKGALIMHMIHLK
jgi:hypothetical protein